VSANHGAQVSHWGFERLLEKARADVNLQELLVERPDLSQTIVEKLAPLISESLAIKLVERGFSVGETLSADLMQLARQQFSLALRDRKANIRGVAALIELVNCGELPLDQAVLELTAEGRLLDVATLLTKSASLDLNDIFGIFTRGEIQTVMMLFRALDLKWATLESVLALRAKKMGTPNPASSDVARDYEALDRSLAKRAIRFLQVRYRLTGAPLDAPEPALATA
jgi:hypothetical protein